MAYGEFLKKNIFDVLGMDHTRHHGNANEIIKDAATGYAPIGRADLQRAPWFDWSIKTGNGSLYSTVEDLARFERSFYTEALLTKASKEKMFTHYLSDTGYGWYLKPDENGDRNYITGRSPGFSTFLGRYPQEQTCIVVLSNSYISCTSEIAKSIASILFRKPIINRSLKDNPLPTATARGVAGRYHFGDDFFRPGFTWEILENNGRLTSAFGDLLHDHDDEFILRGFWSVIRFEHDPAGKTTGLTFDGSKALKLE